MPMPTSEAACGFIIMARISRPRRLERIQASVMVSSRILQIFDARVIPTSQL